MGSFSSSRPSARSSSWRALAILWLSAFVLYGCAASDSTGSRQDPTTTGTGGEGAGTPIGGAGGSGAEGAMGGMGGEGGAMGGEGGMGGGMDPCASGCPVGFWDIDDNPLTGECGCEYECTLVSNDDPIDPDYDDDNCDGGDGLVEQCVYVSASIGSAQGTGSNIDPLDTIANGIAVAQANAVPAVCLSGEVYNEPVAVVSGISIYGGFDPNDPDFAFKRSPAVTTVVTAQGTVFLAPQIDAETHLAGMTINALTPAVPGASAYGVRLIAGSSQGRLYVRYNVINVGGGADGSDGSNGVAPQPATAPGGNNGQGGCEGTGCGTGGSAPACAEPGGKGGNGGYNNASGSSGNPGSGGANGGNGGSASGECFDQSSNGGTGSGGANGVSGGAGAAGANLGIVIGGAYAAADGQPGIAGTNGKGGGGGGGGGGGSCQLFGFCTCNQDTGGGGGSGGCGGLGGGQGGGGQGGGGSFGVFAAGGQITVSGNEITTGGGGDGGDGGNGSAGQLGGNGGTGGGANDDSGGGGGGGKGGNAGNGGPGGGGGGGPSACFGYKAGVSYMYMSNVLCQIGVAGSGGTGGTHFGGAMGNNGANGVTGATLQIN